MSEFIEIHVRPKGEALIIQRASIDEVWASPNGGCLICQRSRVKMLEVSDSYEDLRKMLIGEDKV